MKKSKITICMALHNKNECLENTLFSIYKQKSSEDYNLCFIDDASKDDPLPIIKKYFSEDSFIFKRMEEDERVGFQKLRREFAKIIPEETSIIIWQSCDVIWADSDLLNKLISSMRSSKYSYKPGFNRYRSVVCVPKKLRNYQVPEDLYLSGDKFLEKLDLLSHDTSIRGHQQSSRYLFLGALKKEDFNRALDAKLYKSDGACDMIMRETLLNHFKIPLIEVNSIAVHQRHIAAIYTCTSINECTHPCKVRRKMIARGMPLPWVIGNYNFESKKFDNHPNEHYKRYKIQKKETK